MADDSLRPCPRCGAALGPEFEDVGFPCGSCGGVFIRRERVSSLLASAESGGMEGNVGYRENAASSKRPFELEAGEAVRYLRCPLCATAMTRQNFARKSGVIVDVCPPHGTWFDGGEVQRASEYLRAHGPIDPKKDDLPMSRPAIESRGAFMALFGGERRGGWPF